MYCKIPILYEDQRTTQISFGANMFIDDSGTNHHFKLSNALVYLFIKNKELPSHYPKQLYIVTHDRQEFWMFVQNITCSRYWPMLNWCVFWDWICEQLGVRKVQKHVLICLWAANRRGGISYMTNFVKEPFSVCQLKLHLERQRITSQWNI